MLELQYLYYNNCWQSKKNTSSFLFISFGKSLIKSSICFSLFLVLLMEVTSTPFFFNFSNNLSFLSCLAFLHGGFVGSAPKN